MATQSNNMYAAGSTRDTKKDILLKSSDGFISAYRKWLKRGAGGGPYPHSIKQSRESIAPPSRYEFHIKHSPISQNAVDMIKSTKDIGTALSILSILSASFLRHPPLMLSSIGISTITLLLFRIHQRCFTTWSQHNYNRRNQIRVRSLESAMKQWWNDGSKIYTLNLLANAAIFSTFLLYGRHHRSMNSLCKLSLLNNYMGQIYDNASRAVGSAVGEGAKLRRLTKMNPMLHGFGVPMLTFPITEIATRHGLFSSKTRVVINSAWFVFSIVELLKWVSFDSTKMKVVDKQSIKRHEGQQLAGTLYYSSGKVLQSLLPVFALLLYQFGISASMLISKRGVVAGWLLLISSFLCVLSSTLNRPDIQMLGLTFYIGFVYSILDAVL